MPNRRTGANSLSLEWTCYAADNTTVSGGVEWQEYGGMGNEATGRSLDFSLFVLEAVKRFIHSSQFTFVFVVIIVVHASLKSLAFLDCGIIYR